jgi:hypothetical protein
MNMIEVYYIHVQKCHNEHNYFVLFWWDWSLNLGLCTWKEVVYHLSHSYVHFALVILKIGIVHIYMEIPQGNSLCSYLYLKQSKMSCFSFYLFSFFFYKITEQEDWAGLAQGGWLAPGEGWTWCKKWVYVYVNAKMTAIQTSPGIREVWGEDISGGSEFKYDIFGTL